MEHSRGSDSDKNLQGGGRRPSKKGGKRPDNVGCYSREIGERNERAGGITISRYHDSLFTINHEKL